MSKPTDFADWALNDVAETRSGNGLPNKAGIPDSLKNNGVLNGLLPLQYLNENFNILGRWARYLDAFPTQVTNVVVVDSEADFPTPVAGVITLEAGKHYLLNSPVTTANRFVFPAGDVQISSTTILNTLVYIGGGVMFTGNAGLVVTNQMIFVAPGGTFFDFDDALQFFSFDTIWTTCDNIGNVKCDNFSCVFSTFNTFGGGIVNADRTDTNQRGQFLMIDTGMVLGTNNTTTLLDISGDISSVIIRGGTMRGGTNETVINLQQSLKDGNAEISFQNCALSSELAIFAAGSLDQSYINSNFSGNVGVPDSTAICKISFENNTAVTTISVVDQNEPINIDVDYLISSEIERFLAQDVCTFENVGNTVDVGFNHGLTLNDRVFLNAYAGSSLPAGLSETIEYFVINPNAADFQLSLTASGSVVTFGVDGTGPLQYRHSAGVSRSGELIYVGNEDIKIKIDTWTGLLSTTGTAIINSSAAMKINLDGTITEDQFGSPVTIDNTDAQSSIIVDTLLLTKGEGYVVNVRNNTNTADLRAVNHVSTLTKI